VVLPQAFYVGGNQFIDFYLHPSADRVGSMPPAVPPNSRSQWVPESPLVISRSLACELGLEEAVLLTLLNDAARFLPSQQTRGQLWFQLTEDTSQQLMPFWQADEIQRIAGQLRAKGVLLLASPPFTQSRYLKFAFSNEMASAKAIDRPENDAPVLPSNPVPEKSRMQPIAPHWAPDGDTLARIAQLNIPNEFALQQVGEFVLYWRERNEPARAWGSKFLKHVLARWRDEQTKQRQNKQRVPITFDWQPPVEVTQALIHSAGITETKIAEMVPQFINYWLMHGGAPDNWNLEFHNYVLKRSGRVKTYMHKGWRPSEDAIDVLVRAGVSRGFIEDAIPEFELYWREQQTESDNWHRKFRDHVQRQWASYKSALEHDTVPRRIAVNWQPSSDVYDVLRLANIDVEFARQLLPEFVIYWRDSNQVHHSWNTRFLQYVKRRWAVGDKNNGSLSKSTREISLVEELTDRSWAS
jgi:hypothetical protein